MDIIKPVFIGAVTGTSETGEEDPASFTFSTSGTDNYISLAKANVGYDHGFALVANAEPGLTGTQSYSKIYFTDTQSECYGEVPYGGGLYTYAANTKVSGSYWASNTGYIVSIYIDQANDRLVVTCKRTTTTSSENVYMWWRVWEG